MGLSGIQLLGHLSLEEFPVSHLNLKPLAQVTVEEIRRNRIVKIALKNLRNLCERTENQEARTLLDKVEEYAEASRNFRVDFAAAVHHIRSIPCSTSPLALKGLAFELLKRHLDPYPERFIRDARDIDLWLSSPREAWVFAEAASKIGDRLASPTWAKLHQGQPLGQYVLTTAIGAEIDMHFGDIYVDNNCAVKLDRTRFTTLDGFLIPGPEDLALLLMANIVTHGNHVRVRDVNDLLFLLETQSFDQQYIVRQLENMDLVSIWNEVLTIGKIMYPGAFAVLKYVPHSGAHRRARNSIMNFIIHRHLPTVVNSLLDGYYEISGMYQVEKLLSQKHITFLMPYHIEGQNACNSTFSHWPTLNCKVFTVRKDVSVLGLENFVLIPSINTVVSRKRITRARESFLSATALLERR